MDPDDEPKRGAHPPAQATSCDLSRLARGRGVVPRDVERELYRHFFPGVQFTLAVQLGVHFKPEQQAVELRAWSPHLQTLLATLVVSEKHWKDFLQWFRTTQPRFTDK